jgi:chaperonin GroES
VATNKKKKPAKKSGGKKVATKSKSAKSKTAKPKKAAKVARSGGKVKMKSAAPKGVAKAKPTKKPEASGGKQNWKTFFSPLDDRILVEVDLFTNRTPGGLYIPDTAEDKPQGGVVVAVGRGHRDNKGRVRPLDVKIGDKVLFPKYSGTTLEFGGMIVLVLREGDLLGVTNS